MRICKRWLGVRRRRSRGNWGRWPPKRCRTFAASVIARGNPWSGCVCLSRRMSGFSRTAWPTASASWETTSGYAARLSDYRDVGESIWDRFNGGREGTLWYYRALVQEFKRGKANRLIRELELAVQELEERAEAGTSVSLQEVK